MTIEISDIERRQKKAAKAVEARGDRVARKDFKVFCERVLRDEKTGKRIKLSEIHRIAIDFWEYCYANEKYCLLVLPWGHGKSSIFAVGLPLWWWATHNQNESIKLVSGDDSVVMTRVKQIQNIITGKYKNDFRRIFPHIQQDTAAGWSKHEIFIKRTTPGFPSLWAHSVLSTGEGGRCGGLILDDVVTRANSVQKNIAQDVIDAVEFTWMKRLSPPDEFCLCLNTPWTTTDLVAHIIKSRLKRWGVLKVAVAKNMERMNVEVFGD